MGYYLGLNTLGKGFNDFHVWGKLLHLLIGSFLASGGVSALNEYLERNFDEKMKRTFHRPLPSKRITPSEAKLFGIFISTTGVVYLAFTTNLLVSGLTATTIILYLFVYTPLKRVTTWNTLIGAIPGAMPPLGGWATATGNLEWGAWILFAILFCWQIPHFLSIAILYKNDYKLGGFKMLPVVYPKSYQTNLHIIFFTLALFGTSLTLYFANVTSIIYAFGVTVLSISFFMIALQTVRNNSKAITRRLLFASIVYLPALFIITIIDQILKI